MNVMHTGQIQCKTDIGWIHKIGSHIAEGHALDETLVTTLHLVRARFDCDGCSIYIQSGVRLVRWVARHPDEKELALTSLPPTKRCVAFLARHRQPIAISRDISRENGKHSRFRPFPRWSTGPGELLVAVPLLAWEQLVGVIGLQHCRPRRYSLEDVKLLSCVGFLLGAKIGISRVANRSSDLSLQLETRQVLERGKGILQRDLGRRKEQAYPALQHQSLPRRKPMKDFAQALIFRDELKRRAPTDATETKLFGNKPPAERRQGADSRTA
jgi:hypothetical protein